MEVMKLFLCLLCVSFVNCQFGLFPQRNNDQPRRSILSNIAGTIGNVFRPQNRRPIANSQNNYEQNRPQDRPVVFPTNTGVENNPGDFGNNPGSFGNNPTGQGNSASFENNPGSFGNNPTGQSNSANPEVPTNNPGGFVNNPIQNEEPLATQDPFKVNFVDNNPPATWNYEGPNQIPNDRPAETPEVPSGGVMFVDNTPGNTNSPIFIDSAPGNTNSPNTSDDKPKIDEEYGNKHGESEPAANPVEFTTEPIFRPTCTSANGARGQCVNLMRQCPRLYEVAQSQHSNPTVVNMLRQLHCGFDGSEPKICCPLSGITSNGAAAATQAPPPATTAAPRTTLAPTTQARSAVTPAPGQNNPQLDASDFVEGLPEPPVCGVSNLTLPRVVGGQPAKLGAFPWMALLGYKDRAGDVDWKCGGSIITRRHILTAAHCVYNHNKDLYLVRVGELDLSRDDDGATPVDILIKKLFIHEQYDSKIVINDIAMVYLDSDVPFSDLIKPICMPLAPQLRSNTFENYRPLVAGWGAVKYKGRSATHLQFVQLPVLSVEECRNAYIPKYPEQIIDQRTICAGYKQGKKDACSGDSGGPLMQPERDEASGRTYVYQSGVVSYGRGCGLPGYPGVYTRVTEFLPWIAEKVTGNAP